jgi:hypothetical protein
VLCALEARCAPCFAFRSAIAALGGPWRMTVTWGIVAGTSARPFFMAGARFFMV